MIYVPSEYDAFINGESFSQNGLFFIRRPNIPAAERDDEFIDIPGRSGALTVSNGCYKDVEVDFELNFMSETADKWGISRRKANHFLSKAKQKELVFSDDAYFYRKIKGVTIGAIERTSKRIGVLTPRIRLDPFEYLLDGKKEISEYSTIVNQYDEALPVYLITGEGVCNLTVNGNSIQANVGQNLTINIDLQIAYRTDSGAINNTAISGNYEDLKLIPGENTVSITNGFGLKVIPNWRVAS